ncbi:type I polyketide synthase [Chitinophaga vietnamensis]|uniref:type I polyketide synthase n=1 Tax=Chitinophaga vietnamensis TaxID=2593957 RepID=UPI001177C8FE|nr:type I polyketide synthase [Chitinophaga vietnamensis]
MNDMSEGNVFAPAAQKEPVAVIGMSCRFPGAANLEEFWDILYSGKDTVDAIPPDRWKMEDYFDPDPYADQKTNQQHASMLKGIHDFDPLFFDISPAEAIEISPSQKLMLELAWEAIEHTCIPLDHFRQGKTGVYIGSTWSDFEHFRRERNSSITAHSALGQSPNIIAGRISYKLGLTGPSLVVDTGCSASLVALHLACQALLDGSIDVAMVGGVNHLLDPVQYVFLSKFGGLSSSGRCNAFDSKADGFVRGEGGGIIILKKLSNAVKDENRVLALIRKTGVNNNGFNVSLPATSQEGQLRLLEDTYRDSGVDPSLVHYVEAHGTGTAVGDPVEATALGMFFRRGREQPLSIGSVKTNIGHLEGAAGIAGFIKVVLSMKHRVLPSNLHYHQPNPGILFDELMLTVQQKNSPWPVLDGETFKAGINSFGWGGTNAHAILEEYPAQTNVQREPPALNYYCLPLSARALGALNEYVEKYIRTITTCSDDSFVDICIATALVKPSFEYRALFAGRDRNEVLNNLKAFKENTGTAPLNDCISSGGRTVMVFPGQGSQWKGMGQELYRLEPVFRKVIDTCDEVFKIYSDWSLKELLLSDSERSNKSLEEINVIQPVLFAVELALAQWWLSIGIRPDAVVGHSMGEVAAAFIAGALDLEDAVRIIFMRSQLMRKVSGKGGGMLVTELSSTDAAGFILKYPELSIAAINSPRSTVLAGNQNLLGHVQSELESSGLFARPVKVDVASHSKHMDSLTEELSNTLQGIIPHPPSIPFYSTVMPGLVESADAAYWVKNLRHTVQFSPAIQQLISTGHTNFIEISPHPILVNAIRECAEAVDGRDIHCIPSLFRESPEQSSLYANLCLAYSYGCPVDWIKYYRTKTAPAIDLPSYPFQREHLELEDNSQLSKLWRPEKGHSERKVVIPSTPLAVNHKEQGQSPARLPQSQPEMQQLLAGKVASITRVPYSRIRLNITLKSMGIDSLMMVQLQRSIEKDLCMQIPKNIIQSHLRLDRIASALFQFIEGNHVIDSSSWYTIPIPVPSASYRIFCFHDAGGSSNLFFPLAEFVDKDTELVCIDLPGRANSPHKKIYEHINDLITDMLPVMAPLFDKPFLFIGHSMGALVAFELTRALRRNNMPQPIKLITSSMPAVSRYRMPDAYTALDEMELAKLFPYLDKSRMLDDDSRQMFLEVLSNDLRLMKTYQYTNDDPLDIDIIAIYGLMDDRVNEENAAPWSEETTKSFRLVSRPGGHQLTDENLVFLVPLINISSYSR